MPDEEVNIRVNQVSEGTALTDAARQADALQARIDALRARMAEMNRVESNYASKGMPEAAASVRSERIPVARELRDATREQRTEQRAADAEAKRGAQEKAAAQAKAQQAEQAAARAAARQAAEAEAVEAARATARERLVRAGAGLVERAAGASPIGGVTSALGGLGGPAAMIAAAAAAAAGAVANLYFSENRADEADRITQTERRQESTHERTRRRVLGGAGDAAGAVRGDEDAIAANLRDRASLQENAKPKWYDPRNWSNNLLGTNFQTFEGARGLKQNSEEGTRLAEEKKKDEAEAAKKVKAETEPLIAAQEKMNRGEAQASRQLQDQVTWLQKKRQVLKETNGNEALAERAADAELATIQKQRAGSFAGVIDSRTSGAAAARIATMAAAQMTTGARDNQTGELIDVVKRQHTEAMRARPPEKFSRDPML